ncbi:MAG: 4-(cytidine 5'-diphospho)-2-C-methyl-D-erythritol kinase [Terriglobia bacterium]
MSDTVEISISPSSSAGGGVEVVADDPAVPSGPSNLAYRAAEMWKQARGFRGGITVRLTKRIPAGSGLGGASSDAAATILGLERLTGDRLDLARRVELAAGLGSDVPFFFWGGRALGCGRGEEIYPLGDLPPRHCLIVFPGFSVSTAEAYNEVSRRLGASRLGFGFGGSGFAEENGEPGSAFRESRTPNPEPRPTASKVENSALTGQAKGRKIIVFGERPHFSLEDWGPAENDFEQVVFAKWPELARLKRRLIRAGAETASLTGSGSALYAVLASARKLGLASKLIPTQWQAFRTRTLARAEYLKAVVSG